MKNIRYRVYYKNPDFSYISDKAVQFIVFIDLSV